MNDKNRLFSFRPGEALIGKLNLLKVTFGLSTTSDAARKAMEAGAERLLQGPSVARSEKTFEQMSCNVRGTLLLLVQKHSNGTDLTRSEWRFLATHANKTYDLMYHRNIEVADRDLFAANLKCFAALMALRDSEYPNLKKSDDDRYYFGNMGFSWVDRNFTDDDIQLHVQKVIEGLPNFPTIGGAAFASRNFDVAARDEPALNLTKLNDLLRPYLKSILLVCMRGYWLEHAVPIIQARDKWDGWTKSEDEIIQDKYVQMNTAKNEIFHLSPIAEATTFGCAITPTKLPYTFALNNFVEFCDFKKMVDRIYSDNRSAACPGFELFILDVHSKHNPEYVLCSGRWRHHFTQTEFDALRTLLNDFVSDEVNRKHLAELEMNYGKA